MAGKKKESATVPQKWEDVPEIPREEQPYPLPEGWKWVKLIGGFVECLDSYRKPVNASEREKRKGNIPYYGATGQVGWIDDYLTNENLVLVGEDGAPFLDPIKNKAYIIDGKAWVNNHAHILRSFYGKDGNLFLMHYLNQFNYKNYVNGTTRLKLTQSSLQRFFIPLPQPSTLTKVVAHIESLFSKLDEAAEKVQTVIESHEARKQAILHKAFSGELTRDVEIKEEEDYKKIPEVPREEQPWPLPEGWRWIKLVNVIDFIKAGGDKPDDFQENKDNKNIIPVIANGLENEGIIGYTKYSKNYHKTLTVAARGTIGFPSLRDYDYFPVVRLIVISPNTSLILTKFLYYIFFAFPEKGTGSSIPQLTVPKLKEKIIPLCPTKKQQIIVSNIESLLSPLEDMAESCKKALEKIAGMKKSILTLAFQGRLG